MEKPLLLAYNLPKRREILLSHFNPHFYTSRGHVCGFYGKAILFDSKARKQAHSKLCNCFRNVATGQKSASENRKCVRAKYMSAY
jgi:hypothetical protein